ncbi:hypothetical protein Aduo_010969 [Ancylostoma duodenale]
MWLAAKTGFADLRRVESEGVKRPVVGRSARTLRQPSGIPDRCLDDVSKTHTQHACTIAQPSPSLTGLENKQAVQQHERGRDEEIEVSTRWKTKKTCASRRLDSPPPPYVYHESLDDGERSSLPPPPTNKQRMDFGQLHADAALRNHRLP